MSHDLKTLKREQAKEEGDWKVEEPTDGDAHRRLQKFKKTIHRAVVVPSTSS